MTDMPPFKRCPMCHHQWLSRNDFLTDSRLRINGYQADFKKLEDGLFYFTHESDDCYTTMAIPSVQFLDLYDGPRYTERKAGTEGCPGYCLNREQLDRCTEFCECSFVREVIQIIKKRQNPN